MPPLADMVIHDPVHPSRFSFSVDSIQIIDHGAENGRVGHLAADEPRFDFFAAEKFAHFLFEQPFYLLDKISPLVIVDICITKSLDLPVFCIPEGRIHDRYKASHRGGCHLRRDEIDALSLAPYRIFHGSLQEAPNLRCPSTGISEPHLTSVKRGMNVEERHF
jgi:hypothetical protein